MHNFLALDGGGTKTDVVAFDHSGCIGARRTVGPSNLQNLGEDACRQVLSDAINGVLADVGVSIEQLRGACLGVGGLDTEADAAVYKRIIDGVFGSVARRVQVESDGFISIYAGTEGRPGIALIAGTGSMAVGINQQGERARAGGWGALFGDEGSAFDIGRQALISALRAEDGRGPQTRLGRDIERQFGLPLSALVAAMYRHDERETKIASVARTVAAAAQAGDSLGQSLLREAARELTFCVRSVLRKLTFTEQPIPVVLSGSVFKSPIVHQQVVRLLAAESEQLSVIRPSMAPIAGACFIALRQAGHPATSTFWDNLERDLSMSR